MAGGGAAGVFAAIACAQRAPSARVVVFERGPEFLSKVRISGGGRCNVTHACFDPMKLSEFYPRGGKALIGPFHRFQPRDTVTWFESRDIRLKTEADGRIFPVTDRSQTIVDGLLRAATGAGVQLVSLKGVEDVSVSSDGKFILSLRGAESLICDRLMLATGGCRAPAAAQLAVSLGHSLVTPVPSLFTFQLDAPWLANLAGIAMPDAEISIPVTRLSERGPLLITHSGLSGPAVLRLSAWGARAFHAAGYHFTARLNWAPSLSREQLTNGLERYKTVNAARRVANVPVGCIPGRLWDALVLKSHIRPETRWADLSSAMRHSLVENISACDLVVIGKSLNKDEFVTCGGVPLKEVDFKTMESRVRPGLYFGGEVLDIDGITGGFNFQAAWTTGWIAGHAMAESILGA